jgi:hypothetical protein
MQDTRTRLLALRLVKSARKILLSTSHTSMDFQALRFPSPKPGEQFLRRTGHSTRAALAPISVSGLS